MTEESKLPQVQPSGKQVYQPKKAMSETDIIDPMKYKYSEDKPFPLRLMIQGYLTEALEYLKLDIVVYQK